MSLRVQVLGDDRQHAVEGVEAAGLTVVRRRPDVVLCYGGDGTLLRAERLLPGVPKVPARLGRIAHLCPEHGLEPVIDRLVNGTLERQELSMLELRVGRAVLHALNDVVLRNDNPALAVRFSLIQDGVTSDEYTGDGLVVATPFGSTAYYRSITGSPFDKGIGVAFNNCAGSPAPLLLDGESSLGVVVVRGPGVLVHDNDTRAIPMREGHSFTVGPSPRRTIILGLDALSCQRCRRHDESRFNPH